VLATYQHDRPWSPWTIAPSTGRT